MSRWPASRLAWRSVLLSVSRGFSGDPVLARGGAFYVSFFRGVPLLVQLLFIYYFLAEFGIDVPAMAAAIGGLGFASGAYQAEILRGALNATPPGQAEAAKAFGFSRAEIWRRILLPQALRISVPPFINEFHAAFESVLARLRGPAIAELTRVSMNIASSTYRPLEAYLGAGLFYLAINLCIAGLGNLAERRLAAGWRDELRSPVALCAGAAQRFWNHHPVLGPGRGNRHRRRFRHRIAPEAELRPLGWLLRVYIEIIRGTPFLVQLFLLYSGGPFIGLRLEATTAGDSGPRPLFQRLFREAFRAGFSAVPRGQTEAAQCIGMNSFDIFVAHSLPAMLVGGRCRPSSIFSSFCPRRR